MYAKVLNKNGKIYFTPVLVLNYKGGSSWFVVFDETYTKLIKANYWNYSRQQIQLINNDLNGYSKNSSLNDIFDGKLYETKEEITFLNNDLSSSSYLLFYNIIEEKVEEDEEIEEKKDMEGIAYIDEETYYPFISKEEKEVEDDEVENTRKFMILTGEKSYIEIKEEYSYESDEVEQKLHYEVVQDNQKIVDYKIKIENENQENEIKVEIGEMNFKVEREIFEDTYIYKISLKDDETNQMVTLKREILEDGNISYEIYE